jgi:hypothetical protein
MAYGEGRLRRSRNAVFAAIVTFVAVVSFAIVAPAADRKEREYHPGDDPGLAIAAERAKQDEAERKAKRLTPQARAERQRSRRAYRGQGRHEAVGLAKRELADELLIPVWHDLRLRSGEKLERYTGTNSAMVSDAKGREAVVQSSVPMLATDERGRERPVELALRDAGDSLEPDNPIVATRFPKDPRKAVELGDDGLGFRFVDPSGDTDPVVSTDGRAAFTNIATDTDMWLKPAAEGAAAEFVVRSEDAPERVALDFDLPVGATMERDSRSGAVAVMRAGKPVALVEPPYAEDADGEQVEVTYTVEGRRLGVEIAHRGADLHYPLYVDPMVREDSNWEGQGAGIGYRGWEWNEGPDHREDVIPFIGYPGTWGDDYDLDPYGNKKNGLLVYGYPGTYEHGDYAEWLLRPFRSGIHYPRVDFITSHRNVSTCAQLGIWGPTNFVWDPPIRQCHDYTVRSDTYCAHPSCGWDWGNAGAHATAALVAWGGGPRTNDLRMMLKQVYVYLWDKNSPNLQAMSSFGTRPWAETDSVTVGGRAIDGDSLSGNDVVNAGVGLDRAWLSAPNHPNWGGHSTRSQGDAPQPWTPTDETYRYACTGTRFAACPDRLPVPIQDVYGTVHHWGFNWPVSTTNSGLAGSEGHIPINAWARDFVARETGGSGRDNYKQVVSFRIDRSRPAPYTTERGKWHRDSTNHQVSASIDDAYSGVRNSALWIAPVSDRFERSTSGGWGAADQVADPFGSRVARWRLNETSGNVAGDTATTPELVTNPSFETDTSGWATTGGYFMATSTIAREADSAAPDGGHAGKVVTPASWQAGAGTNFNVQAGQQYRVRVKVKRTAGSSNLRIALGEVNGPYEELVVAAVATPSTTDYTEYTGVVTPSRSGAYRLYVRTTNNTASTFWIDAASVRQENNGTYTGGYTQGASGATPDGDRAVLLDGVSGRVTTGFNPFAGSRTFEGWAKRSSSSTDDALLGGSATVSYPALRAVAASNDIRFNPDVSGAGQSWVNAIPAPGTWFHWALVWNADTKQATLYVNGQSKGTLTYGHGFGGAPGTLQIGAEGATVSPFHGHLDDVAVHNTALSPDDVQRSYSGRSWVVEEGPASDFSTSAANGGRIDFPSGGGYRSAMLLGRAIKNVDVSTRIKFGQNTTGSGVGSFAFLTLRRQSNGDNYRVGLVPTDSNALLVRGTRSVNGTGSTFIDQNTNLGFTRDRWYRLRVASLLNAAGTASTIQVKYWLDGTDEPIAWNVTLTDSAGPQAAGAVGVRVNGGSTSAQQFYFDDLKALDRDVVSVVDGKKADGSLCDTTSGCPNTLSHPYALNTSSFAEGPIEVVGIAGDAVFHGAANTADLHRRWDGWNVKMDRTAPAQPTLSGALWEKREKFIGDGSYALRAEVAEGNTTAQPNSGIAHIRVYVDDPSRPGTFVEQDPGGAAVSGCNGDCQYSASRDWTFNTANRPQGERTIRVIGFDKAGNASQPRDFKVNYDNTPPTVALSGSLYDARNTNLNDGTHTLYVTANDGTGPGDARRSGVRSIEVFLDGESVDYASQSCAAGNCSMQRTWTLNTSRLTSGGTHTVEVVATDQLGHEKTEPFSFTRNCCLGTASTWGTFLTNDEVAYGDADGDGIVDAITRNPTTAGVSVRRSTGTSFSTPAVWGSFPVSNGFAAADVDGDGDADVIGRDSTGDVKVSLSNGASAFGTATSWGTWATTHSVGFADIDGDGASDLFGRDASTGDVSISYSDAESAFEPALSMGNWASGYVLSFADVNADGQADAVGRNSGTGDIRVMPQADGTLGPAASWGSLTGNHDMAFGDVNGDTRADAVARNRDTGAVQVLESSGTALGSPTAYGSFGTGPALNVEDVSGDGREDIVGSDSLGTATVARSQAPAPAEQDAPDFEAADTNDDPLPAAPALPTPTTPPSSECPDLPHTQLPGAPGGMRIAFQDERTLHERSAIQKESQYGDPFGAGEPHAVCTLHRLYDRMRQAGASVVRFFVHWGRIENKPTGNDANGNPVWAGGRYYWDKLDKAVDVARANNFEVQFTITGWATGNGNDCVTDYNPNGIGCVEPTGNNPCPDFDPCSRPHNYKDFVEEVVRHYTRNAAGAEAVRVRSFSLWNEPNHGNAASGSSLNPAEAARQDRVVPVSLYGQLYGAGYLGYKEGLKLPDGTGTAVAGTRVLMGELSSKPRRGMRGAGQVCVTPSKGKKRCTYTAVSFLQRAVTAASSYLAQHNQNAQVRADGVALHPYQYREAPHKASADPYEIGMGRLKQMNSAIKGLCGTVSSGQCTGELARDVDRKTPELHLTEFGYHNRASTPDKYQTESKRASYLLGSSSRRGALRQGLVHKAVTHVMYHLVERSPIDLNDRHWDTGLIAEPYRETPGDGDVTGCRYYGKPQDGTRWGIGTCEQPPDASTNPYAQTRQAYCAIRRWAIGRKYFDPSQPEFANSCPP